MTFLELDIGDYFIQWDTIDENHNIIAEHIDYNTRYMNGDE
jgi:hypothetical protein